MAKTITTRRREVRKGIPRQHRPLRELVGRAQVVWGAALVVLFIVLAGWITLSARSEPEYQPGQLVDRAQVARVAFESLNREATEQAREDASAKTPAVYTPNDSFLQATEKKLSTLPTVAAAAENVSMVAEDVRRQFGLTEAVLKALRSYQQGDRVAEPWNAMVEAFMADLRRAPVVRTDRFQLEKQNLSPYLELMVSEDSALRVSETDLVNVSDQQQVGQLIERIGGEFPEPVRGAVATYFKRAAQPTYQYDKEATAAAREAAAAAVEPQTTVFEPGQAMVEAGTRLDQNGYRLLRQERREYLASLPAVPGLLFRLGPLALVALVSIGLGACAVALHRRVAVNSFRALALAAVLLITLALAWGLRPVGPHATAPAAVAPAMLAAVILTIVYNQRFAIAISALHAVLIGLALELSIGMYLVTLTACVVAIVQVRQVRQRGALIRAGLVTGLVVAGAVFAARFSEYQLVEGVFRAIGVEAGLGFLAAVAVGFFVLGVLPLIERIFRVTTAMTLLELCDVNQPLLRRLAQQAAGTYNHSLQVGTLAEAASEAIGADGLLARVAAYYHDIGKMNKPHYFVENQAGGSNPHDNVSPAMSLLIIVGHVKDGAEMAKEYGLPPVLLHFIESHHGTTLVEYFYHEAKKRKGGEDQPEEVEFRYPGPKPQSREAAILMLCDAVESASRSLAEPTATRIEQLVHKLASKRLNDGQFDHCQMNFAELRQVEAAITKSLTAIYHGRIAYPSGRQDPKAGEPKQQKERVAG